MSKYQYQFNFDASMQLQHGAQETVKKIIGSGGIAKCWECDTSQAEEVNECARQVYSAFGKQISILNFWEIFAEMGL